MLFLVFIFFIFYWHLHRCAARPSLWRAYADGMAAEDAHGRHGKPFSEIKRLAYEAKWLWRYPSFPELRVFLFLLGESWHAILAAAVPPFARQRPAVWYFLSLLIPWFVIERHGGRFRASGRPGRRCGRTDETNPVPAGGSCRPTSTTSCSSPASS